MNKEELIKFVEFIYSKHSVTEEENVTIAYHFSLISGKTVYPTTCRNKLNGRLMSIKRWAQNKTFGYYE